MNFRYTGACERRALFVSNLAKDESDADIIISVAILDVGGLSCFVLKGLLKHKADYDTEIAVLLSLRVPGKDIRVLKQQWDIFVKPVVSVMSTCRNTLPVIGIFTPFDPVHS